MEGKRNIKLILSWSGVGFSGYQKQPHAKTVQGVLEEALSLLLREPIGVIGCSRLDAQVHAYKYTLNFLTTSTSPPSNILRGLNGLLHQRFRAAIAVYHCEDAPLDFHARFHSVGKHYRYLIWYGFGGHASILPRSWHVRSKEGLDRTLLASTLKEYEGTHDFGAFRAADCGAKNTLKHIERTDVFANPHFPEGTLIDIWGNGFLKNMIRNMLGTAIDIVLKKHPKDTIAKAFLHKNRSLVGVCAPPWALTLMDVFYDRALFQESAQRGAQGFVPF